MTDRHAELFARHCEPHVSRHDHSPRQMLDALACLFTCHRTTAAMSSARAGPSRQGASLYVGITPTMPLRARIQQKLSRSRSSPYGKPPLCSKITTGHAAAPAPLGVKAGRGRSSPINSLEFDGSGAAAS